MIYSLREDVIEDEEHTEFTVYGIDAVNDDNSVISYPDISFDIEYVKAFVAFCKRNNPTPEILDILIENLL